jgi:nitrite reductase/ring-hydroxylating ferredoxin subunit
MSEALREVGTYARRVRASAERVWENVHDWEHLPFLHAGSFRSIRCERADAGGWRARVGLAGGAEIDLELSLESDRASYHARTLAGPGAGTDIWTRVREATPDATDITVSFLVPGASDEAAARLGAAFVQLYTRLWDEDEAMMRHRQAFLDGAAPRPPRPGPQPPHSLGSAASLRGRLPLAVSAHGSEWWVREHAGRLVAHAAACPHWGAPLAGASLEADAVVCPWHGFRFDLATGRGPASQRCRMPARAEVRVSERGEAWLVVS